MYKGSYYTHYFVLRKYCVDVLDSRESWDVAQVNERKSANNVEIEIGISLKKLRNCFQLVPKWESKPTQSHYFQNWLAIYIN